MSKDQKTNFRTLHANTRAAALVEYGMLAGLIAVVSIAAVSNLGREVEETYNGVTAALASPGATDAPVALTGTSCDDIYTQGGRDDGIYTITTGGGDVRMACHFETTGVMEGGWTVIALQSEGTPETDWNAGIAADRADGSYYDGSFALSSAQIPAHSAFAVGRRAGGAMQILEGISATYSTGDVRISGTGLLNTTTTYDIHRDANGYYGSHDPENTLTSTPSWHNTLTFDANTAGGPEHTWAFSPMAGSNQQGYSYDGVNYETVPNSFSWLVYVR